MTSKRARKAYSVEFKQEAVRRMHERRRMGISLAQIARELEVRAPDAGPDAPVTVAPYSLHGRRPRAEAGPSSHRWHDAAG